MKRNWDLDQIKGERLYGVLSFPLFVLVERYKSRGIAFVDCISVWG